MKKTLLVLALGALILGSLAGCGDGEETETTPTATASA